MQISERGQVTIPKELRAKLGFLPHTEVEFIQQDNQLILVRKRSSKAKAIRTLRGRKKLDMTTDELMSLLRDGN